ncbi:MAG: hypothetical protein HKN23_14565, partial [Verrucomicrobiales bacterium]|nr:hypothetical protein [Verrucomicrobiales bacterium]
MVASGVMRGKIFTAFVAASLPVLLFAYDAPNFDQPLIDVDGVNLPEDQFKGVVEALSGLAANFPSNENVDSDLREKALLIALTLDPLNHAARTTHEALRKGENPPPTGMFEDLSEIAGTLWKTSESLLTENPTPDHTRLAMYLMEISLTVQKDPPLEQARKLGALSNFKPTDWGRWLELQPENNFSGDRILRHLAAAQSAIAAPPGSPDTPSTPPPANPPTASDDDTPVSEIKRNEAGIAAVCGSENGPFAVFVSLKVHEASEEEAQFFSEFLPDGTRRESMQMQIHAHPKRMFFQGAGRASEHARAIYKRWPDRMIADLTFRDPGTGEQPKFGEEEQIDVYYPTLALLQSVFSGREISDKYIVMGMARHADGTRLRSPNRITDALNVAQKLDRPRLLVPTTAFPRLLEAAKNSTEPTLFLKPQIIGVEDFTAMSRAVFEVGTDDLNAAAANYESILKSRPDGTSLGDYLTSSEVKSSLQRLVSDYPNHLSAKLLLEIAQAA